MKTLILSTALICAVTIANANAAESNYNIIAENGHFSPATLEIPAGQKVQLNVQNKDVVEVEFESYKLDREEKIDSGESTQVFVGPLDKGNYEFFDDNNPDAKGMLVVK